MKKLNAIKEIRSFNRYYTSILGLVDRYRLTSPYSLTEVRILFEIYHNTGATVRKIKHILCIDEGYLSRTIDQLTRQGLITKKRSQSDGRVFILSLTKEGVKEFLELNQKAEKSVELLIDHLAPEETDEIVSLLRRVRELLTKNESGNADEA